MNTVVLENHISSKINITEEELNKVLKYFSSKMISKKNLLVKEGQYNNALAFVTDGCLRSYYSDENGNEHILQFAPKGWWITDMYAMLKGTKSELNIEAIIDSKILLLTRAQQLNMFDEIPKMERYFRILTENALCATRQRVLDNMSTSAKDRYVNFCNTYSEDVTQLIPQKYVAAYIGVTPEFLSKMKHQIKS